MKDMGIIQGSAEHAVPLIVGKDTVYVHTDILKLDETDDNENPIEIYQYHEIQYDKDEYIKIMAEQNEILEKQITDTQLALCEIYEGVMV